MTKHITGLNELMKVTDYEPRFYAFTSSYIRHWIWLIQPYTIDYTFVLIYGTVLSKWQIPNSTIGSPLSKLYVGLIDRILLCRMYLVEKV